VSSFIIFENFQIQFFHDASRSISVSRMCVLHEMPLLHRAVQDVAIESRPTYLPTRVHREDAAVPLCGFLFFVRDQEHNHACCNTVQQEAGGNPPVRGKERL
jgi:hypothetical protein